MRGVRCLPIVAAVGLVAGAGPGRAVAQAPDPVALEEAAYQDFVAGRLDEALRGYERVYRLAPRPEVLFAIGNLQQQLGRCDRAIEILEDYLASGATGGADKARALIAGCRRGATAQAGEVEPDPPEATAAATAPRDGGDPGRGRRRAALVLGGFAVIAAGGAIASELTGRWHLRESERQAVRGNEAERDAEYDSANRYHYLAQGVAIAAGACAVTAGVLWITGRRGADRPVAAAPVRGGAMVTYGGAF